MIAESRDTSLAHYARTMAKLTETAFLAQISCPVLVESARVEVGAGGPSSFRTEYLDESDVSSRILPPDRREVLLLKKRVGAAFSGHISIGRTPNLDLCIARTGVSKFHAYILEADGGYQITDKDSTNGTFVDGVRLSAGGTMKLRDGAEVRFATHSFMFMLPGSFLKMLRSVSG
ncbi:MAG: FHA domain-containing protein [Myxococcales bacterium]